MSSQVITCAIQIPETKEKFICSAIYESNLEGERRHLWDDLRSTHSAYNHLNLPWILIGDYNVTLSSGEQSRARDYLPDQAGMRRFQEMVSDCALSDLAYVGALFTWWNKQEEDPIWKKLDRALINNDWLRCFPDSYAQFEAGGISDHARCLIRLSATTEAVRKPFRFFNFLTESEEFLPTVAKLWESTETLFHSRASLGLFHKKLNALKFEMRALNRNHYEDLASRTKQAYEVMCEFASSLVAHVLAEEIQGAIHSLPVDKVSGPDGYTKEFYVAAWPIIGKDCIVAVQSFFMYGFLPTGVNATILSLIPKIENAQTMKEYRSIACSNFLYKVISKILATRLQAIFPDAVESNQCAFIKGRLLLENVLLASELVNGYPKKTNSDRCTIKFDISKAFDTV
ncbi:uncharacterized protein LOC106421427 [Brassica napus]|uniref:uncharacterized protein LOC106421427 n=1 Tax=Brassica napus TaxID=3708 RepID=UPI0006AA86B8|nr:uncharacterized protein LOC106421427 [Brassica napus]